MRNTLCKIYIARMNGHVGLGETAKERMMLHGAYSHVELREPLFRVPWTAEPKSVCLTVMFLQEMKTCGKYVHITTEVH